MIDRQRALTQAIRLTLVLAGVYSSTACTPYIGTCAWLDLTGNGSLRVVAPRKVTAPQECNCSRCAAPGQFQIRRERYVLEFWNGDRWYPELVVRARTNEGHRLALKSDQLHSLAGALVGGKWREFDYYADVINVIDGSKSSFRFPERLLITVLDEQGRALGTEEVLLRLETRRHLAFESV
jgi:hypothetical protein